MRFLVSLLFVSLCFAEPRYAYFVAGDEPSPWSGVLSSIGMVPSADGLASVFVIPAGTAAPPAVWLPKIEAGAIVILEGESPLAAALGIQPTEKRVATRNIVDQHNAKLPIIWERQLDLPVFTLPATATVFARERWTKAPVIAGLKIGMGAALWVPVTPGKDGHERFPYALQALRDLGLDPPFRGGRLWAFFDSSYRLRADPDYMAERWRKAGIGGLQVAAWHFWEPDEQRDAYLKNLIEACHRRAIHVYAWVELPHVSEKFWNDHPAWREKTALLQDAQLDWRKLMNLANADCSKAVATGFRALTARFDWDGVNLAELYFESLEGVDNPSRFTPFNDDVRKEFESRYHADAVAVAREKNSPLLAKLLDFRAELAERMQLEWLARLEELRKSKPQLDLVLTHVDDRFDTRMRQLIGADSGRLLPLLEKHDFTFLIEDPATVWHLGPQRYPEIAKKYEPVTPRKEKLAIDINVVERYQDVYPTKQQTGIELFQLVHLASAAFPRVALYFENSILRPDLPLLASSSADVKRVDRIAHKLVFETGSGTGVAWKGAASVNGKVWPVANEDTLWLPPGAVAVEQTGEQPALRVLELNARLKTAASHTAGVDLAYESAARALVVLDRKPRRTEIDGAPYAAAWIEADGKFSTAMPRGQHLASFFLRD